MYSNSVLALLGAISTVALAVPMQHQHHQRDFIWVTHTEEAVVTIPVTQTVWIEPGETAPAPSNPAQEHSWSISSHASSTEASVSMASVSSSLTPVEASTASTWISSSSSSVYVAPSSSTTSVYVASISSSSSVYVAPTTSTSVYVAPTTSTSVYVAPTTSTSVYVAPTTSSSSVYVAPTSQAPSSSAPAAPSYGSAAPSYSSSAPAPSSSSGSTGSGLSSGMAAAGTKYTGDLTWYEDGMGACGIENGPSDPIVAISHIIFDAYNTGNPNNNPVCGKFVTITGADGSPYTAKVVDRCVGCAESDLDLSENFFNSVTNNGNGRVPGMTWVWN